MQTKDGQCLYLQSPTLNQLNILREVAANSHITQAELANRCSLSVAMVNNYMKELCRSGLLEYHRRTAKSVSYHLTPDGVRQLETLEWQQIDEMVSMFAAAKDHIRKHIAGRTRKTAQRIVLIGTGNLAQLALHALELSGANILGVCDENPELIGREVCGRTVLSPSQIRFLAPDAIIVADEIRSEEITRSLDSLSARGINVIRLEGHGKSIDARYKMHNAGSYPITPASVL